MRSPSGKAGFHLGLCNELRFKKQFEKAKVVHCHVAGSAPILATAPMHIPPYKHWCQAAYLYKRKVSTLAARQLSEARCIGILLGESKDAVQAAMDHGKFSEYRECLRAWSEDHPIEGERTCVVKNPLKKTARGRKRATPSQLANAA